jgi:RNA polymerase sigma-70 factor (ECF subfamily)
MSSEEILVDSVIRKRNEAVKALYDRYAPALLGLCCRYCASREDAEDVLHEGFMKILKNLPAFRTQHPGSLMAWMKRIMVNTALNHLRSRNRKFTAEETDPATTETEEGNTHDFFGGILGKISKEEILGMIVSLPDGYRAVFNLYVFEEYSHREIAETLHCTENTSKSQLSKARALLRKNIEAKLKPDTATEYGKR